MADPQEQFEKNVLISLQASMKGMTEALTALGAMSASLGRMERSMKSMENAQKSVNKITKSQIAILGKYNKQMSRAAKAQKNFYKAGLAMGKVLRTSFAGISAGIVALGVMIKRTGSTMTEFETVSIGAGSAVTRLQHAYSGMEGTARGAMISVQDLAGALTKFQSKGITEMMIGMEANFKQGAGGLISALSRGLGKDAGEALFGEITSSVGDQINILERELGGEVGKLANKMEKARNEGLRGATIGYGEQITKSLKDFRDYAQEGGFALQKTINAMEAEMARMRKTGSSLTAPIRSWRDAVSKIGTVLEDVEAKIVAAFGPQIASLIDNFSKYLNENVGAIKDKLQALLDQFNKWGGIEALVKKIGSVLSTLIPLMKMIGNLVGWLASTFVEAGSAGKTAMLGIGAVLLSGNLQRALWALGGGFKNLSLSIIGARGTALKFVKDFAGAIPSLSKALVGVGGGVAGYLGGGAIAKGVFGAKEGGVGEELGQAYGAIAGAGLTGGPFMAVAAGAAVAGKAVLETRSEFKKADEALRQLKTNATRFQEELINKIDMSKSGANVRKSIVLIEQEIDKFDQEIAAKQRGGLWKGILWKLGFDIDISAEEAKIEELREKHRELTTTWNRIRVGLDTSKVTESLEKLQKDFDEAIKEKTTLNIEAKADVDKAIAKMQKAQKELDKTQEKIDSLKKVSIGSKDLDESAEKVKELQDAFADLEAQVRKSVDPFLMLTKQIDRIAGTVRLMDRMNEGMSNFKSVVDTLGPGAEIAGTSIAEMMKAGSAQQMAESYREIDRSNKTIALATERWTTALKEGRNEDALAYWGKIQGATVGIAKSVQTIESGVENMNAPLEKQAEIVRTITELRKADLDISQALYGTPALAVQAQLNIVQLMQQEKELVEGQLANLSSRIDYLKSLGASEANLVGLRQKEVELAGKARKLTALQLSQVRELRDGYLSATTAAAFGAQKFSKIILSQEANLMRGLKKGAMKRNFLLGQYAEDAARTTAESYRFSDQGMGLLERTGTGQVMGEDELLKAVMSRANAPADTEARAAATEAAGLFMDISKGANTNTKRLLAASRLESDRQISAIEALGEKLVVRGAAGAALGGGANAAGTTAFGEAARRTMGGKPGTNQATGFGGVIDIKDLKAFAKDHDLSIQKLTNTLKLQGIKSGEPVPFDVAAYTKYATEAGADSGTINAMVDFIQRQSKAFAVPKNKLGAKLDTSAANAYYKTAPSKLDRIGDGVDPKGEFRVNQPVKATKAEAALPSGIMNDMKYFGFRGSSKLSLDTSSEISPADQTLINKMRQTDREVKKHENRHAAAGGKHVQGRPEYSYKRGPDGKRYAVGGRVLIDVSPVRGDPEATIEKMQQIRKAALAPRHPSDQDMKVAATTIRIEEKMRQVLKGRQEQQRQQLAMHTGVPAIWVPSTSKTDDPAILAQSFSSDKMVSSEHLRLPSVSSKSLRLDPDVDVLQANMPSGTASTMRAYDAAIKKETAAKLEQVRITNLIVKAQKSQEQIKSDSGLQDLLSRQRWAEEPLPSWAKELIDQGEPDEKDDKYWDKANEWADAVVYAQDRTRKLGDIAKKIEQTKIREQRQLEPGKINLEALQSQKTKADVDVQEAQATQKQITKKPEFEVIKAMSSLDKLSAAVQRETKARSTQAVLNKRISDEQEKQSQIQQKMTALDQQSSDASGAFKAASIKLDAAEETGDNSDITKARASFDATYDTAMAAHAAYRDYAPDIAGGKIDLSFWKESLEKATAEREQARASQLNIIAESPPELRNMVREFSLNAANMHDTMISAQRNKGVNEQRKSDLQTSKFDIEKKINEEKVRLRKSKVADYGKAFSERGYSSEEPPPSQETLSIRSTIVNLSKELDGLNSDLATTNKKLDPAQFGPYSAGQDPSQADFDIKKARDSAEAARGKIRVKAEDLSQPIVSGKRIAFTERQVAEKAKEYTNAVDHLENIVGKDIDFGDLNLSGVAHVTNEAKLTLGYYEKQYDQLVKNEQVTQKDTKAMMRARAIVSKAEKHEATHQQRRNNLERERIALTTKRDALEDHMSKMKLPLGDFAKLSELEKTRSESGAFSKDKLDGELKNISKISALHERAKGRDSSVDPKDRAADAIKAEGELEDLIGPNFNQVGALASNVMDYFQNQGTFSSSFIGKAPGKMQGLVGGGDAELANTQLAIKRIESQQQYADLPAQQKVMARAFAPMINVAADAFRGFQVGGVGGMLTGAVGGVATRKQESADLAEKRQMASLGDDILTAYKMGASAPFGGGTGRAAGLNNVPVLGAFDTDQMTKGGGKFFEEEMTRQFGSREGAKIAKQTRRVQEAERKLREAEKSARGGRDDGEFSTGLKDLHGYEITGSDDTDSRRLERSMSKTQKKVSTGRVEKLRSIHAAQKTRLDQMAAKATKKHPGGMSDVQFMRMDAEGEKIKRSATDAAGTTYTGTPDRVPGASFPKDMIPVGMHGPPGPGQTQQITGVNNPGKVRSFGKPVGNWQAKGRGVQDILYKAGQIIAEMGSEMDRANVEQGNITPRRQGSGGFVQSTAP